MNAPSAETLELTCMPLGLRDQHSEILALLGSVPSSILRQKPALLYWHGLALLSESNLSAGQKILNLLESAVAEQPDNLNEGRLLILKALESVFMGDSTTALDYAQKATSLLPETAHQEHFRAWATREVLGKHIGDIEESERAFSELTLLRQKLPWDQRWWFVFVVPNHADWLFQTGQMDAAEQLLQAQLNVSPPSLNGIVLLRLARIALEQGDIGKAEQWLDRLEAGTNDLIASDSYWSLEISLLSAEMLRQSGELQTAVCVLTEAIKTHHHYGSPAELRAPNLMMTGIWVEQKHYDLAARWIELYSRHTEIWPRTFGQPISKIIEAALLIARSQWREALEVLTILREQGEERGLAGLLVQVHSRRAYVYAALGDERAAVQAVKDVDVAGNYAM